MGDFQHRFCAGKSFASTRSRFFFFAGSFGSSSTSAVHRHKKQHRLHCYITRNSGKPALPRGGTHPKQYTCRDSENYCPLPASLRNTGNNTALGLTGQLRDIRGDLVSPLNNDNTQLGTCYREYEKNLSVFVFGVYYGCCACPSWPQPSVQIAPKAAPETHQARHSTQALLLFWASACHGLAKIASVP